MKGANDAGSGSTGVPVKNLFHLLCYAWGHWRMRDLVDVSSVEGELMGPLVAQVLAKQLPVLLRRGLDRAYVDEVQVGTVPRGKLLVGETLGRGLLARQQLVSERSEFTRDIPKNQVLLGTVGLLLRDAAVPTKKKAQLRALASRLAGVTHVELRPALFRRVLLHRNNAHYGFLVLLCQLYASQQTLSEENAEGSFADPWPDRVQALGYLFESFVVNFLRIHLDSWSFSRPQPSWSSRSAQQHADLLPRMKTDIVATAPSGRRLLVDTKFYKDVFTSSFGGKPVLRSDHLYQLLTYCRALSSDAPLPGMLLYAQSGAALNLELDLLGHAVSVRTLDLSAPWDQVEENLRSIFTSLLA